MLKRLETRLTKQNMFTDDKTSMCIRRERTQITNFWFKYTHPKYELLTIRLNPLTTFTSLIIIIAFIIWCICDPNHAQSMFLDIKKDITYLFTWLYIGSQDLRTIFIIWLYFSKYGKCKLGKDNDEPEFSDAEWFSMLFACGIGIGLFFFSVSEPLRHYTISESLPTNRYVSDSFMPDNTLAQIALTITYYHWGLHAWVVYCVVGIILAFTSFRWDLPLTMKSCFYPLIGEKIFGWLGDSIDIISIVTTIFGVCTSLGIGAIQVNAGLNFLVPSISVSTPVQMIIIWTITFCATISVVSGLRRGIRRVSQASFIIGVSLLLVVLFLDETQYILNLFIQSLGFYVQNIIQLSFHTDAFEQLSPSYGAKDRGRVSNSSDGESDWMNEWTVFYWSWWITWSPFVGAFIAKISRGRTIREFIHGALTAPVLFSFFWLTVFGGSGMKMERASAERGLCCPNWDITHHTLIPHDKIVDKDNWGEYICQDGVCNPCSTKLINGHQFEDGYKNLTAKILGTTGYGSTVMVNNQQITRLSCHEKEAMWFYLMASYGEIYGSVLSVVSMFGLFLYLLTSSDSGSLIIDTLASNGDNEPPVTQRIFWALVEGGCASSLLAAGGQSALVAIQTASIVAAFPYTLILNILCVSIYIALVQESRNETDPDYDPPAFSIGLLDFVTTWQPRLMKETLKNVFLGPYNCGKCLARINHSKHPFVWQITLSMLLIGLPVFYAIEIQLGIPGSSSIAWTCYLGFVFYVTGARVLLRQACRIPGNLIADFFICLFLWPTVVVQMKEHIDNGALNIVPNAPDHDSLDSRLDKGSVDSEMDNIAKLYTSFGTSSNNQPQKTDHENSLV
ncbi:hypothetical protein ACHWQZ_G008284 [Mnemiopsis leidyi]